VDDIVLLVADKNIQFALRGALSRPKALGIRPIKPHFLVHSGRDGGVRTSGHLLLRAELHRYGFAMMLLDHEGSGQEQMSPLELENELDRTLRSDWGNRAKVIVIDPEVDIWIWGSDNALRNTLDWRMPGSIREWLSAQRFEFGPNGKPSRPKEAFEAVIRKLRRPRSSSEYEAITSKVSLRACRDPAFARFRDQLRVWFPAA
jgi:hypothetical protein